MRKTLLTVGAVAITAIGAAAVAAGPVSEWVSEAFGPSTPTLSSSDIRADIEQSFIVADVDQNGVVDENEFAGYAVVVAELAQFSGLVAIAGPTPTRIDLPVTPGTVIELSEREAIFDDATRLFHVVSEKSAPMTALDWQHFRLTQFENADANGDALLQGEELAVYAARIAKISQQIS